MSIETKILYRDGMELNRNEMKRSNLWKSMLEQKTCIQCSVMSIYVLTVYLLRPKSSPLQARYYVTVNTISCLKKVVRPSCHIIFDKCCCTPPHYPNIKGFSSAATLISVWEIYNLMFIYRRMGYKSLYTDIICRENVLLICRQNVFMANVPITV